MVSVSDVSEEQILAAFNRLCNLYGVISAGFHPENITAPIDEDKHDGKERWAIKYRPELGYMIVCGWKGCGVRFGRWNCYMTTKWDFLMLLECLAESKESK